MREGIANLRPRVPEQIRPAALAGKYYPEEPEFLSRVIDKLLAGADAAGDWPKAVIAPHAGLIHSGAVAASALAPWTVRHRTKRVDRVVLMGPSHYYDFPGVALADASAFATPLATAPVDLDAVEALLKHRFVRIFEAAHLQEHSLEVLLPFVQRLFPESSIVPLIVGRDNGMHVSMLVEELWGGDETVFVISSDLSHHQTYENAQKIDRSTARAIQRLDINKITADQACGFQCIRGFLRSAVRREMRCSVADLRNSGDTANHESDITGYGAFQFFEN
jgi:AmmeMemoRadiSam system protein B